MDDDPNARRLRYVVPVRRRSPLVVHGPETASAVYDHAVSFRAESLLVGGQSTVTAGHRAPPFPSTRAALRSRPVHLATMAVVLLAWGVSVAVLIRHLDTPQTAKGLGAKLAPAVPPSKPSGPGTPKSVPLTPSASRPSDARPRTPRSRTPAAGLVTQQVFITLYSARDNPPPGSRQIASPAVHKQAGGTGSFSDPTTFAASKDALRIGTKIYSPPLRRYFVMEDACAS